jgi:hypothetical protein
MSNQQSWVVNLYRIPLGSSWGLGLLGSWELGHLGTWALGLLGTWALGHLGSWALGHLGSWALGLLGNWPLGLLCSWGLRNWLIADHSIMVWRIPFYWTSVISSNMNWSMESGLTIKYFKLRPKCHIFFTFIFLRLPAIYGSFWLLPCHHATSARFYYCCCNLCSFWISRALL